jgi:hypothetical protein
MPSFSRYRLAGALVLAEVSQADEVNGAAVHDPLVRRQSFRPSLETADADGVMVTVVTPAAML